MNEMSSFDFYWASTAVAFAVWPVSIVVAQLIARVWAWIDDSPMGKNPLIKFVMPRLGWKISPKDAVWGYYKGCSYIDKDEGSDGFIAFFLPWGIIGMVPTVIALYQVSLIVGSIVGSLFIARFVRRLSKKFVAHVNDADAHKGELK